MEEQEDLTLIKKRILLVNEVLKNKRFKNQIVDRKRIREIHKTIRRKSIRKKIDTSLTKKIWKSMIQGFINYEYKNFKKK